MNKEEEVTEDFTLFTLALKEHDGRQYPINAAFLKTAGLATPLTPLESIPWGELLGRRITSVWMDDGYLVLGLSTKE